MKLIFDYNDALKAIIQHSRDNPCKVPYQDAEFPGGCIWIVKDEGVYLMSAGRGGNPVKKGEDKQHVVYARGFDPNKDEDVWDKSREACGGDDFVEAIPLETIDSITSNQNGTLEALFVEFNGNAMDIGSVSRTKKPEPELKSKEKAAPKKKKAAKKKPKAKKKPPAFPKPKVRSRPSSSANPL